jgi:hypothetical protein
MLIFLSYKQLSSRWNQGPKTTNKFGWISLDFLIATLKMTRRHPHWSLSLGRTALPAGTCRIFGGFHQRHCRRSQARGWVQQRTRAKPMKRNQRAPIWLLTYGSFKRACKRLRLCISEEQWIMKWKICRRKRQKLTLKQYDDICPTAVVITTKFLPQKFDFRTEIWTPEFECFQVTGDVWSQGCLNRISYAKGCWNNA